MQVTEWPPQFTIKRHWRSRHVKMTFSRISGLQITLPKRYSTKHIPSILEENKDWILSQQRKHYRPDPITRSTEIEFLAVNKKWSVHYFQTEKRPRVRQFASDGIILSGDIREFDICHDKLVDWIRKQAKLILPSYLAHVAHQCGLTFSDVSVRSQATLWGSCSHDKSIRLNYKLLFLPEGLMRHIMIHELCHTRYMDHSEKFWRLVASFDSNWKEHKNAMRRADNFMPSWILK